MLDLVSNIKIFLGRDSDTSLSTFESISLTDYDNCNYLIEDFQKQLKRSVVCKFYLEPYLCHYNFNNLFKDDFIYYKVFIIYQI